MNLPVGTITFMFTDIEGSTQLWERQPEAMKAALARHDTLLREAISANSGHVFKTVGDAFCAAFASAADALQAALSAQRALQEEAWSVAVGAIRIRVALHTGIAEERDGDYFGPPLNRVARLLSAGHGGQILLSLATQELVRDQLPSKAILLDLGEHRLKDLFRPEHIYQLSVPDLPAEFPPLRTLDARLTNLPAQPTPLIGREREVAAILSLMRREDVRLVTLTGPGGTGKTRLSLQVAADLLDEYEQGVYFVNLAPISDPDLVVLTIASTLGVKESGEQPIAVTLKHALRAKHMLLVLDNFEQIIEAAPQVGDLLAAAPKLKIMVSSREALRVRGEHNYPVPPLGLPEKGRKPTLAVLSQYESVALFIQRAKAARPDFEISDNTAPAVAEICVRLDGLPLAIELAAARSRMLTPQAMLDKLSSRLKALTGGARDLPARQQTLRAAIDWSYDLLDEQEKKLFARLSVFQGGRSIEAVETVCGPGLDLDVTDGLESLLNKSLLRQEEGLPGEARFVMLETIHEYARERLADSGEAEAIHRRHAAYFTAWVEGMERELRGGPTQLEWFERLEAEHGNVGTTLEWSLGSADVELGMRLVAAIWLFWSRQGHHMEWRRWATRALEHIEGASSAVQAGVHLSMGMMLFFSQDLSGAKQHMRQAVAIYRQLSDKYNLGWALIFLGLASVGIAGEYDEAITQCEQGLALLRELGDKPGIAQALSILGELARSHGDFDRAKTAYQQGLDAGAEIGDKLRQSIQYGNLAFIAQHENDYERAEALSKQALALSQEIGNKANLALFPGFMAGALGMRGQPRRAARLIGASEALCESMGIEPQPADQPEFDRGVALVREQLGEELFEALRAEGRSLSLDEAVQLALAAGRNDE